MSISVIVATYGEEDWAQLALERAVPSAGSDSHVIPMHYPGGNVATSRNAAACLTKSDWLCFLDADDELAPGYVGAMERAIEKSGEWHPCPGCNGMRSALCGDCEGAFRDRRLLLTPAVSTIRNGRASPPTFFKECDLRHANWIVIGTLIHRDLFWEVGGFPEAEHGLEDWALWSKCVRAGAEIVKVPDAVYRYWANPQSMHRILWRDKKAQVAAHRRVADELDEWEAARA